MLRISSFSKEFNGYNVLNIPELLIPHGVSWFQGINGSGKSTFFKAISGIIPFEGEVAFSDGLNLKESPIAFRKRINYCFAEPQYPSFVSGKEILAYYQSTYNESQSRLDELVRTFAVSEFYEKPIGSYSSGMLKKISLISGFIGTPDILALDEPFTTIDTETQEILLHLLLKRIEAGKSVLIASHHHWNSKLLPIQNHFKVENRTIYAAG